MLSNVPATIIFYVLNHSNSDTFAVILAFNVLKLFRLVRITKLLGESHAVSDFILKHDSQWVALGKFSILIVILVHWFACIWCWVAYVENGSFDFSETNNWIHAWVLESGGGENAPEPYGPNNAWDRYILAFFWACQTVTSIGYGNISPQTKAEWWVASILQLIAGVCWSYVIGGLIGIVRGMSERNQEFGSRSDDAIDLFRAFRKDNEIYDDGTQQAVISCNEVTMRIRSYIHQQYKHSKNIGCISSLNDNYPILKTLPPDLQRQASLLILRGDLDYISYLSSYYLSVEEQGRLAMQCMLLEFPAGERVDSLVGPQNLGRGIYLVHSGSAFLTSKRAKKKVRHTLLTVGSLIGVGRVLMEDDHKDIDGMSMFFLTYSKVLFIPRAAVLEALNEESWKGSARWIYARATLGHSDTKVIK